MAVVNLASFILSVLNLRSSSFAITFRTKPTPTTYPREKSDVHDIFTSFLTVGLNFTNCVTFKGRAGLFGSIPGVFVGIGF